MGTTTHLDPEVTVALQGTLDTFALPDVLRLLAATKKTGRLRTHRPPRHAAACGSTTGRRRQSRPRTPRTPPRPSTRCSSCCGSTRAPSRSTPTWPTMRRVPTDRRRVAARRGRGAARRVAGDRVGRAVPRCLGHAAQDPRRARRSPSTRSTGPPSSQSGGGATVRTIGRLAVPRPSCRCPGRPRPRSSSAWSTSRRRRPPARPVCAGHGVDRRRPVPPRVTAVSSGPGPRPEPAPVLSPKPCRSLNPCRRPWPSRKSRSCRGRAAAGRPR